MGKKPSNTNPAAARVDRLWFGPRVIVGAMVGVVVVWAGSMVFLSKLDQDPAWWPEVDSSDAATIEQADHLERAFASQASMVRQNTDESGADWRVAINQVSANAWLAVRLRGWAADGKAEWPDAVESIRVGFDDERVTLGVRLLHDSGASVAWLMFTPEVRSDGSVWVESHGARIGGVPVPDSWVISQMESHLGPGKPGEPSMRQVLAGEAPIAVEPVVHLPDGRDVRILDLHARGGRVELSLRTESSR